MNYILKHFDTPLIRFHASEDTSDPEITILWINEANRGLLPMDLGDPTEDHISKWLQRRTIPKNRAFVRTFLAKCGLSANRPMSIISVSKGLSLNDSYWVVGEDFEGSFDQYNLYDNRFSQILAYIAFTGYGSSIRSSLMSSPEFTTNGMLPKCWRRIAGKIVLYKGLMPEMNRTPSSMPRRLPKLWGLTRFPMDLRNGRGYCAQLASCLRVGKPPIFPWEEWLLRAA